MEDTSLLERTPRLTLLGSRVAPTLAGLTRRQTVKLRLSCPRNDCESTPTNCVAGVSLSALFGLYSWLPFTPLIHPVLFTVQPAIAAKLI